MSQALKFALGDDPPEIVGHIPPVVGRYLAAVHRLGGEVRKVGFDVLS
ncbi:MAG: hypothetical protein NTX87_14740 [Planctomycetota bacterium]|nr:hypothetical protein [Planctomycetota bacterium]